MGEKGQLNYHERVFKKYEPEDAGQKVGWSVLTKNLGGNSYYLVGAYATVGRDGGSVSILETTSGERLFYSGLTRGLGRACAYSILLDLKHDDIRLMNTDVVTVNQKGADELSGYGIRQAISIDDPAVRWAKGESQLAATLRATLESEGLDSFYKYAYLSINGRAGHQVYLQHGAIEPRLNEIADVQIYDPDMTEAVRYEIKDMHTMYRALQGRINDGENVLRDLRKGKVDPETFEEYRQKVATQSRTEKELARKMTVPLISYVPEGRMRTWPYMDASEQDSRRAYGAELDALRRGNVEHVDFEMRQEIKELEKRKQYARRGAHVLSLLTTEGRELIEKTRSREQ